MSKKAEEKKDNVVTHARFGAAERLEELREQGIVLVEEERSYDEIDLPEVSYGEQIVSQLNEHEKALFFAFYDASRELERLARLYMGRQVSRLGDSIGNVDQFRDMKDVFENQPERLAFDNEAEAKTFFQLEKKVDMLKSTFHWTIAERIDRHEYVLGVRTKGRVVAKEKRY